MGIIYDRIVAVHRPASQLVSGEVLDYAGLRRGTETVVATGLIASVQTSAGSSRPRSGDLPSAPPAPIQWMIFIRRGQIAAGQILERDVIEDDLGRRFHVSAADCHFMGWTLYTIILEAH